MKKTISIVVPCYNEAAALPLFYQEALKVIDTLPNYNFEFIFVDDGSTDETLNVMKSLAEHDPRIFYVSFSRNFGKEAALLAGLEHASGDLIATMDADCQDPPSLLPELLKYVDPQPSQNPVEKYDCAATRRVTRKGEPPIRSFCARIFYKLINRMSKVEMVDGARDYRLMTRQVVDAIISCQEYNRYSKGLWAFVGFKTKWVEYENVQRVAGETKWSFWKLFKYAIEGIVAFSTVPLTLAAFLGVLFCLIAFVMIIVVIIKTLAFGDPAAGWPSLVCLIMFTSGIQLFFLGVIGEYLAKAYLETKHRPHYITRETNLSHNSAAPHFSKDLQ
jgi:glycosyltransferase involved in cell wall biosynthesis